MVRTHPMQEILLATARRLVGARREAGRGARRGKRWRMAPREEEDEAIGAVSSRARGWNGRYPLANGDRYECTMEWSAEAER
jgi:hypothetical protein